MDIDSLLKNLHPLEIKILLAFEKEAMLSVPFLMDKLNFKEGHANQAFSWLSMKNLVKETRRTKHIFYEATELGLSYAKNGIPEARVFSFLK